MRNEVRIAFAIVAAATLVAACGTMRAPRGGAMRGNAPPSEREQNIRLMLSYDGNSDGSVTHAELEAGLRRQFMAADENGDGRLDAQERRAENERRFRANGTGASPLIDWNQDGSISFDEFATTARSLFDELDRNHDGVLDTDELRLPRGRMAPQTGGRGMNRRRGPG